MAEDRFEDQEFLDATRLGQAERDGAPIPISVRYDPPSGRVVVEFANGSAFMVPARSLQGLEQASETQLADVSLLGETGLRWEAMDIDFTIAGLMHGIFGTAKFMDARRRGGQSKSEAKVAASRSNGVKGGRPRKTSSPGS
jgi:hypothetical protein